MGGILEGGNNMMPVTEKHLSAICDDNPDFSVLREEI